MAGYHRNLPVDPAMPWQILVCVNVLFGEVVVYAMEGEGGAIKSLEEDKTVTEVK